MKFPWGLLQHEEIDKTNPYVAQMLGEDTISQALHHRRRDWQVVSLALFVALCGALYCNYYQLTQYKEVPYLVAIDQQGMLVPTQFRRPEQIGDTDPQKQAILRLYVKEHVTKLRERMFDLGFVAKELTSVQLQLVGSAFTKFAAANVAENPFERAQKEKVDVVWDGSPFPLSPTIWQANWKEVVSDRNGHVLRIEPWTGRFQLAENPAWAEPDNVFGVKVSDREIERLPMPEK